MEERKYNIADKVVFILGKDKYIGEIVSKRGNRYNILGNDGYPHRGVAERCIHHVVGTGVRTRL